jgi:hypothetical protein
MPETLKACLRGQTGPLCLVPPAEYAADASAGVERSLLSGVQGVDAPHLSAAQHFGALGTLILIKNEDCRYRRSP